MKDPRDEIQDALQHQDFLERIDAMRGYDAAEKRLLDRLEAAESAVAWHQRRWMALQMHQARMRDPERTMVCDIIANGELMHPTVAGDRYALQGAAHAPSVPNRITPEQAPAEIRDYCHEAAEGYADGWNACVKAMKEESK